MIRPDQRIEVAERALAAGQTATAQRLLVSVVEEHPGQGRAWYLLSQTTENAQQRDRYLHRAIQAGYSTTIPLEMLLASSTDPAPLVPTTAPPRRKVAPGIYPGATFLRGGCFASLTYAVLLTLILLVQPTVSINLTWLAIWFVVGGGLALIGAAFNPR